MGQPLIDLINISKSFDNTMVLDDLNLSVKENTFVTLLGPSGCGKTTTLRIIGGFEHADTGKVIFDGQDISCLPLSHTCSRCTAWPSCESRTTGVGAIPKAVACTWDMFF